MTRPTRPLQFAGDDGPRPPNRNKKAVQASDGIMRYLDCWTGHITYADNQLLYAEHASASSASHYEIPLIAGYEQGWILYVPGKDYVDDCFATLSDLGFSDGFRDVLRYAAAHDCQMVRLDCDASPLADLKEYNW